MLVTFVIKKRVFTSSWVKAWILLGQPKLDPKFLQATWMKRKRKNLFGKKSKCAQHLPRLIERRSFKAKVKVVRFTIWTSLS